MNVWTCLLASHRRHLQPAVFVLHEIVPTVLARRFGRDGQIRRQCTRRKGRVSSYKPSTLARSFLRCNLESCEPLKRVFVAKDERQEHLSNPRVSPPPGNVSSDQTREKKQQTREKKKRKTDDSRRLAF